jgi:outer membrane protein insertion porin family
VDPFTVRDIRIEGLQRVEPGTVFGSLPFRVGDQYNDEKGSAAIRALFAWACSRTCGSKSTATCWWSSSKSGPPWPTSTSSAPRSSTRTVLKKALREIGLTEGRPYDQALADRAEQELKRQYINRSLYGAEVVTTVTPIERNRVNLTFT